MLLSAHVYFPARFWFWCSMEKTWFFVVDEINEHVWTTLSIFPIINQAFRKDETISFLRILRSCVNILYGFHWNIYSMPHTHPLFCTFWIGIEFGLYKHGQVWSNAKIFWKNLIHIESLIEKNQQYKIPLGEIKK